MHQRVKILKVENLKMIPI